MQVLRQCFRGKKCFDTSTETTVCIPSTHIRAGCGSTRVTSVLDGDRWIQGLLRLSEIPSASFNKESWHTKEDGQTMEEDSGHQSAASKYALTHTHTLQTTGFHIKESLFRKAVSWLMEFICSSSHYLNHRTSKTLGCCRPWGMAGYLVQCSLFQLFNHVPTMHWSDCSTSVLTTAHMLICYT